MRRVGWSPSLPCHWPLATSRQAVQRLDVMLPEKRERLELRMERLAEHLSILERVCEGCYPLNLERVASGMGGMSAPCL